MTRDEMIEAGARALLGVDGFAPTCESGERRTESLLEQWRPYAAAVVDAIHPDDEYEQVGWGEPIEDGNMDFFQWGISSQREKGAGTVPVYVKREPAPRAEPDRCPTCGSNDPERYDDGCQDTGQPLSMTIDGDLVYGKPDPWHTEGADR